MFCRSLFVLLAIVLSVFELQLLVTHLLSSNLSFMERPKENKTYLGLSIISSFESIVVVYVGLLYELPRPNYVFKQSE